MNKTIVHHERATALTGAGTQRNLCAAVIKLGVDIHSSVYVVVAQHDHATPRPPRRFAPSEFLPWVESLLREGHEELGVSSFEGNASAVLVDVAAKLRVAALFRVERGEDPAQSCGKMG